MTYEEFKNVKRGDTLLYTLPDGTTEKVTVTDKRCIKGLAPSIIARPIEKKAINQDYKAPYQMFEVIYDDTEKLPHQFIDEAAKKIACDVCKKLPAGEEKDTIVYYAILAAIGGIKWMEQKRQRWISVTEYLPPIDQEVIVLTDVMHGKYVEGLNCISYGHIVDKKIAVDYAGWNIPGVHHWMHCPKLPDETLEDTGKKTPQVRVTCYGKTNTYESPEKAIDFFEQAQLNSEGSERDRYTNILIKLRRGETEVDDDRP